ncbi:hypothetical protein SO802_003886 [Lithocarpus litseifolius]|uniref:RNase H type-1 domain-containing protein n=1 Tax=Lithocarpus litseifolius TaxID=425828 RepID=A0AAW2E3Z2_9ROSI
MLVSLFLIRPFMGSGFGSWIPCRGSKLSFGNACLQARGMLVENLCPHCNSSSESILHALRDCHILKAIWHQLGISYQDNAFYSAILQDWIMANCRDKGFRGSGQVPWNQTFMFAIRMIWKGRNQLVFENKKLKTSLAMDIKQRALEYFHCVAHPGLAGGGGLLREVNGNWVGGFARRIGTANGYTAKLWALRDGLLLCRQMNVQAVVFELDVRAIVDVFNHQARANTVVSSIMDDCKYLVTQIPQMSIRHIYREANRSADWLANLGLMLDSDFEFFPDPPVDLIPILEADCRGMYCYRQCTESVFSAYLPKKSSLFFDNRSSLSSLGCLFYQLGFVETLIRSPCHASQLQVRTLARVCAQGRVYRLCNSRPCRGLGS